MTLHGIVTPKRRTITILNGTDVSPWIDISRCSGGSYRVPALYTNVGATNFQFFDVSNDYGDPSGTPVTGILPLLANTAVQQQHSLSAGYVIPPSAFNFRWVRFNGFTNENAQRDIQVTLNEAYLAWKRLVVNIASGQQNSGGVSTGGLIGGSITTPTMTSTALTFGVSDDGATWSTLKTVADANVSQTIAAGTVTLVPLPADISSFRYFRVQSGSAEAALRPLVLDLKYVA